METQLNLIVQLIRSLSKLQTCLALISLIIKSNKDLIELTTVILWSHLIRSAEKSEIKPEC